MKSKAFSTKYMLKIKFSFEFEFKFKVIQNKLNDFKFNFKLKLINFECVLCQETVSKNKNKKPSRFIVQKVVFVI
jgi:hypothetical protein